MKLNRRMFLATTASAAVLTALAACAKNGSGPSGGRGPSGAPREQPGPAGPGGGRRDPPPASPVG